MTKKRKDSKPTWVDPDDAPELDDAWFAQANFYKRGKLVRRGRAVTSSTPKAAARIHVDKDVLAAFRKMGPGWESHMNGVLRNWLFGHLQDSQR